MTMKVRIGISLGDGALDSGSPDNVLEFIDLCESWDIDSVWVSDRIAAPKHKRRDQARRGSAATSRPIHRVSPLLEIC